MHSLAASEVCVNAAFSVAVTMSRWPIKADALQTGHKVVADVQVGVITERKH